MTPIDFLYLLLIGFIRTVKWVELQFLRLFSGFIINQVVSLGREWGIVFHFSDESYRNWSPEDEKGALSKCEKYSSLVHIRMEKAYLVDIVNSGSWATGEGWVNGKWSFCEGRDENDAAEFIRRCARNDFTALYYIAWNRLWSYLEFDLFNLQTRARCMQVAEKHYDLGNDVFEATADPWLQYSAGYWANADNLNDSQLDKMEMIAKKLKLMPGMKILDIGCGWGMLCKYLAERHGVECVGVTVSVQGAEYARKVCEGLKVEIKVQDYREVEGTFDRVVSIGMFEHVGFKNYKEYFTVANRHLKEDGIFLLNTLGLNHKSMPRAERWLCTRIYPNGCLPKLTDLAESTEGLFVLEDWHNYGPDFAKTLVAWRTNFKKNWPALEGNYDGEFYRTWIYYLFHCEALFEARKVQVWEIVFSKHGLEGDYRAYR